MDGYAGDKDAYLARMRRMEPTVEPREIALSQITYTVTGMSCGHCVSSVTEEVSAIDGVTGVVVDLPSGAVTVTSTSSVGEGAIRAAVREAGYDLES